MISQGNLKNNKSDDNIDEELKFYYCNHCGAKIAGLVVARYKWTSSPGVIVSNDWVLCSCCSRGTSIGNIEKVISN